MTLARARYQVQHINYKAPAPLKALQACLLSILLPKVRQAKKAFAKLSKGDQFGPGNYA